MFVTNSSVSKAVSLFITTAIFASTVPFGAFSVAHAATILSENFGTGSTGSLPSGWSDGGNSGADAEARAAGSGNDSASANGGRFGIAFGEEGWFCRMVTTTGYANVQLSYQWRGDSDANSSDRGIVEIRTTPGSSCTSATGWVTLADHDLNQDGSWTTQAPISNAGMNNASFALRFRVNSSDDDEHFRVDGISVTGDAGDTTAPTVTNVTSSTANGAYNVPDVVNVQVTFSEVVLVTGTPRITLETGATDRAVNYTSGSGTATLTFAYTVQAGDTSLDLDYVSTSALVPNGGTIRDAASNNAVLTLAAPGAANSLGANKNIVIDTTAPVLVQVTPVPALTNDSTPNYTFSSTEAGSLVYAGGCTSATTNAVLGNNPVTFFVLADGTYASCTVQATDAAGNQSNALAVSSFDVDTIAPVITISGANPLPLGTGDPFVDPGATAIDARDGSVAANPSGSVNTGAPGTYTITYTATDAAGNSSTATRAVNVSDDDAPVFSGVPANMIIEATSAAGAIVTYTKPTANDNVDGDVSANVVCTPDSGTTFPFGLTTVSCTVADAAGNDATTSFTVTVQDTTDPVITVTPGNQTLEATSPSGAVATFTVSATDNIDGDVSSSIICNRSSGSTFAIGVNNVLCLARDTAGNIEGAPFTITVVDTTAPTIVFNPETSVTVFVAPEATEGQANFTATATDIADIAPTVVCTPASGSMLPLGVTTVSCTATDASGNAHTATLPVTVRVYNTTSDSTDPSPFENPAPVPPAPAAAPTASTTAPVAPTDNTTPETEGEVLGDSCTLLNSYVGMGNDVPEDVRFVQSFLNKELGLTLEANGTFDSATKEAVKVFQLKYIADILAPWIPFGHDGKTPTGIVFKTTQYKINVLSCPGLNVQMPVLP